MVYQQFLSIAEAFSESVAIASEGEILSYGQLNQKITALAGVYAACGVHSGSVIAVCLPNSIEFVIAAFAAFRLGAAVLPLNVKYTDHELEAYVRQSGTSYIVGDSVQLQRFAVINHQACLIDMGNEENAVADLPVARLFDTHPALILFSSGSTGGSKQVTRSYANLVAEWQAARETLQITSADVILCSVPMFHSHGFGNCILAALLNGAELVIVKGEFNPRAVAKAMIERQVTIYPSSPFMLKMLSMMRLKAAPSPEILRLVFSAGAPLDQTVSDAFAEVFSVLPCQLYGSTETGAVAINIGGKGPAVSVGKPLANTEICVFDDDGELLPAGATGEIAVRSAAAALAYDGLPEQTQEAFRDGFYFTGDLGFFDRNGYLHVTGRKKLMINVAGLKVDPAEVEGIIQQLPGVVESVVLGKADVDYGELIKAVIVADGNVTEQDVIQFCKANLAEYKLPKIIEFRSEIPRSPLGKILRKYL